MRRFADLLSHIAQVGPQRRRERKPVRTGTSPVRQRRLFVESLEERSLLAALMQIELSVTDSSLTPISSTPVGSNFYLLATVQDLRPSPQGVFAAYADVHYDSARASIGGPITYYGPYTNGTSGNVATPGFMDEVGAFDGLTPLGGIERRLFAVPLHADTTGTVNFTLDLTNMIAPAHDSLIYGQSSPVFLSDIQLVHASVQITGGGNPWHNSLNPLDVNGDTLVTEDDAILVSNFIDTNGAGIGVPSSGPAGPPFYDVNNDHLVTAVDAFLVWDALPFVVTTTSDEVDGNTSSISALRVNRGPDYRISLREAILAANNTPGHDTIGFNISPGGVQTIQPLSALPTISDPATIDGWTQPGFAGMPLIEINGASVSSGGGLIATAGNTTIRGLAINRFSEGAIGFFPRATSMNNVVEGCFLGTDVSGSNTPGYGNASGVFIEGDNNRIGTNGDGVNDSQERNVISGNYSDYAGVFIVRGSGNRVAGNLVGTDVTGTQALGNKIGIIIQDSESVAGNSISHNTIAASQLDGIQINRSSYNRVYGNLIGTNAASATGLGNQRHGILVNGLANVIGTNGDGVDDSLERNIVAASGFDGVRIQFSVGTIVAGNYIGTDTSGMAAMGNGGGVVVTGGGSNRIGTNGDGVADVAERNIISGSRGGGVSFDHETETIVAGNYIGTNKDGTAALPNFAGVWIAYESTSNWIGTNGDGVGDAVEGNLISGNTAFQVTMRQSISGVAVTENVVAGNLIGTDKSGNVPLGNSGGIWIIEGARGNRIGTNADGTSDALERNVIATGILLGLGGSNVVQGNSIGVGADSVSPLPGHWKVYISGESTNNQIGGRAAGTGNIIANGEAGVVIDNSGGAPHPNGNTIAGNSIFGNTGLGIDINRTSGGHGFDGVNPNDLGDGDSGNNQLQNYPVLSSAHSGGSTRVLGNLNSVASASFTLDFYASTATDPSGHGEGQRYLGSGTVTTDGSGNVSFDFPLLAATATGEFITATATDAAGNTSEFSFGLPAINPNVPPSVAANNAAASAGEGVTATNSGTYSDGNAGDNVTITASKGTITKTGTNSGTWSWSYVGADDEATHTVTITADDGHGGSSTTTFQLTFTNLNPNATANSYATTQATAVSGNVISDNTGSGADSDPAGASDPLSVSSHTSPANGTLTINANGSFTYTPDSTFSGTDSFTYTIGDGDGGMATATVTITVAPAAPASIATIPDSCLGGTALLVTGTATGDLITVVPGSTSATLIVTINGVESEVARPSGRVIVAGGSGDDNLQIAGSVANPVWLYGGGGNDRLNAGGVGGSLIIGGDGNDELLGGSGRDVMIGGQGADRLIGNANDDILVAGLTTKDSRDSAGHEEFWCQVLEEWNGTNDFLTRVNNLRGNNGSYTGAKLFPEVIDDFFDDEIDFLNGASGNDWLIFLAGEDKVVGQTEAGN